MEVVDIKKILVPNLLIYTYLHCVRSSSWCATMLATLADNLFTLSLGTFWISLNAYLKVTKVFLFSNRGLVCLLELNVNTLPRDSKNTNVLIMKILSNGVASDEKCIETDVFIDIFLLSIRFYMSKVNCKESYFNYFSMYGYLVGQQNRQKC